MAGHIHSNSNNRYNNYRIHFQHITNINRVNGGIDMGLFNRNNSGCCCNNINANTIQKMEKYENKAYLILGSGDECKQLEENLEQVLKEKNIEEEIEHITKTALISMYGVMKTPALVINQKVVSIGKVLDVDEIRELIE